MTAYRNGDGSHRAGVIAPGAAWGERADALAEWAERLLFNRTDGWGEYRPEEEIGKEITLRDGKVIRLGAQQTVRGRLTRARIARHFRATRRADVLGAHTADQHNRSKGGGLDIDQHGDGPEKAEANLSAALAWYSMLSGWRFRPLLYDSNGAGGYHLRVLLAEPTDAEKVYWLLKLLTADHADHGFPRAPEQFPKQPDVRKCRKGFGNWLRLPGRHHRRDCWSTVWDGNSWLSGHDAVDFILSLSGDAPDLIPWDAQWQFRVGAYMRTLPTGLGEGEQRDDHAFRFLAFMVRDLSLEDAYALEWARRWDAGNRVPKGSDRLREILANVHAYGRNGYGSGLGGRPGARHAAPGEAPRDEGDGEQRSKGQAIILDYLWDQLKPSHKRGTAVYSTALDDWVKPSEARYYCDDELMRRLDGAADRPTGKNVAEDRNLLPAFCNRWLPPAWADLLKRLLPEEDSGEVPEGARERFRRQVAAALYHLRTFDVPDGNGGRSQQHRTLLAWCLAFADSREARPDNWLQVRSLPLWCRKDRQGRLRISLRVELFDLTGPPQLRELSRKQFSSRAARYDVSTGAAERAHGHWVVDLHPDYVAELRRGPAPVDGADEGGGSGAGTHETDGHPSTEGENAYATTT